MFSSIDPEWIGYVGAVLTSTSYMPQVIKVIREKHTKSISISMYFLQLAGVLVWITYAWLIQSSALLFLNITILFMVLIIITMKLRYG